MKFELEVGRRLIVALNNAEPQQTNQPATVLFQKMATSNNSTDNDATHHNELRKAHDAMRPKCKPLTLRQSTLRIQEGQLKIVTPPCKPEPAPNASPPPSRQKHSYRDAEQVTVPHQQRTRTAFDIMRQHNLGNSGSNTGSNGFDAPLDAFRRARDNARVRRQQQTQARADGFATTCEYIKSPRLQDFV